jgi:uncharacterized protein (TIGR03437 family)
MRSLLLTLAALVAIPQVPALAQSVLNQTPSRVVGQPSLTLRSASPNVVEGREFFNPYAVAVDLSSTPKALYVSDTGNNRVLAWRDSAQFANGAPADLVIGQVDKFTTTEGGPDTPRTTGLRSPSGLAVDRTGNLYVVDSRNNRVLRFPKPFSAGDVPVPDLVIGQPGLTSNNVNNGGISASSVALVSTGLVRSDIAFDGQGNLWLTDTSNNRVLRYPANALTGTGRPAADTVLGQPDFATNTLPPDLTAAQGTVSKTALNKPVGVTVDPDNRVYVSDGWGRVLVFAPPYFNGKEAVRIVGLAVSQPGAPPPLEFLLQNPQGLFMAGNRLGVVDPALSRIVVYDPFSTWPAETETQPSPPAKVVIGQSGFGSFQANRGLSEASEKTLSTPVGAFYTGSELFVADTGNSRMLVFPQIATDASATRLLGQTAFNFNGANLVEGRELYLFNGYSNNANLSGNFSDGAGIAIDKTAAATAPHLYIADTFNNRILGYRDARTVRPGDKADIVIGQNGFERVLINAPANDPGGLTDSGLFRPSGLAVDASGNLWVADSGNGRVLRFPAPFNQMIPPGERPKANLVIGQSNFIQKVTDASSRNMAYPFGIAFTFEGHLLVSDAIHDRVLFFRKPENADFTNGQAAERVIGQPDFFSSGNDNALNRFNSPRHISTDTDDRLYVADAGNNRVLVFDRITTAGTDPFAAFSLTGVQNPQGIFVSPLTGEIWVANTRGNRATRFPRYERLAISTASDYNIPSSAPLAVTQDANGNLYVAEGVNRIAIFYNGLVFQTGGNYANRPLSPGSIAILYPAGAGVQFGPESGFSTLPLPTELGDTQVLLNEKPVHLYYVSPFQINFLVPMNAPDSGTAEIQVLRKSTGQVVAISNPQFDRVSPALFVQGFALEGQLAALNEDNTVNNAGNPIHRGQVIQMFGTGQGFVPNAPEDGTAPTGPINTQERPRVVVGADFVKDEDILYSGLAPTLVGVWQLNVRIPQEVAPGAAVDVAVVLRSVFSNRSTDNRIIHTTIAVVP